MNVLSFLGGQEVDGLPVDAAADPMSAFLEQPQLPHAKRTRTIGHKRAGREMAMQFLYQFDLCGRVLDEAELELFWRRIESNVEDEAMARELAKSRPFAERLISGVVDKTTEIDAKIEGFSLRWDIRRMAAVDRNILRVAIYEILFCPDIPPLASINEAIDISKDFGSDKSGAFINGILNGLAQTR